MVGMTEIAALAEGTDSIKCQVGRAAKIERSLPMRWWPETDRP